LIVTPDILSEIASKHGLTMSDGEAEDYLFLLNSLDATLDQVANLPEYLDARLLPEEGTLPRTFEKLDKEKNPLNAWSHVVCDSLY
jgi:hypothetical protein